MGGLPADFADTLARVLEPGHGEAAAGVIEAATLLDDHGLRRFLELFAARVRASAAPTDSNRPIPEVRVPICISPKQSFVTAFYDRHMIA